MAGTTRRLYFILGSRIAQLSQALSAAKNNGHPMHFEVSETPDGKRFRLSLRAETLYQQDESAGCRGTGTVDGKSFDYALVCDGDRVVLELTPLT